jgi:hypothetical protein
MRGLYGKYTIIKNETGKEVEGDYFVLKLTDPHAPVALRAYADSCRAENSQLANDLLAWLDAVLTPDTKEGKK